MQGAQAQSLVQKIPHAAEQLSLYTTMIQPTCPRAYAPQ